MEKNVKPGFKKLCNDVKERDMGKSSTRHSGIECLRILAALFVVMLHYNDGRAFTYVAEGSGNQYLLFLIESIGVCAVDLFVLISGYFLCSTQKRSVLKPLELIVQVIVFREAEYVIKVLIGQSAISIKQMVVLLVPNNYFVILYAAVYFISPYINVLMRNFTKKQWHQLIAILVLTFSVWPTLVDLSEEVLGSEWFGLSTVSAWGSQQGFNVVNFLLMYVLGGYLRYCGIPEKYNKTRILLPVWIGSVVGIFVWSLITQKLTLMELRSAWVYHNPLVILSTVVLFAMFTNLKITSKVINNLSSAAFTCFLLHSKILGLFDIETAVQSNMGLLLMHILFVALCSYLLAWVVHKLYHFMTAWAFKLIARIKWCKAVEYI